MNLNEEAIDALRRIETAGTAGVALDAIPDDWPMFLSGPDGASGFSCSIAPPGSPVARRIHDRGLSMGSGATRLEAIKAAVAWIRARTPSMAA